MKIVKLWNIVNIKTWKLDANAKTDWWQYPFFTCSKNISKISTYSYDCECVLVAWNGDLNVKYYNWKFDAYQRTYIIENNKAHDLDMKFLYYFMQTYIEILRDLTIWWVIKYIKLNNLTDINFPLPPLSTQKQIVQKLDKLTELISLRKESIKKQEDLTKSIFIEMFWDPMINEKGWEVKKLWNIFELKYGKWLKSDNRTWKWYSVYWSNWLVWYHKDYLIKWKWIVVWRKWSIWKLILTQENFYPIDTTYFIEEKSNSYNLIFIFYLLSFLWLENMNKSAAIPWLNRNDVYSLSSIFPPISLQNKFASIVQKNEENIKKQKESLEKLEELYNGVMQESFKF